jgi:hypothetical protein
MMFRHLFVLSTNNANGRSALKWERFDAIAASDYLNTGFGIVARYSLHLSQRALLQFENDNRYRRKLHFQDSIFKFRILECLRLNF